MKEKTLGGALTVGALRRALEDLPGDLEVGVCNLQMSGTVSRATGACLDRAAGVLVLDEGQYGLPGRHGYQIAGYDDGLNAVRKERVA